MSAEEHKNIDSAVRKELTELLLQMPALGLRSIALESPNFIPDLVDRVGAPDTALLMLPPLGDLSW